MKAAQINNYGDASIIQVKDIDKPELTDGKVLVEVYASSINPIDTMLRSGIAKQMMPLTFPSTIGGDFAGVVTQVGGGVTNVAVGDKVYGQSNAAFGNSGAMAEFTVTAAEQLAKAPSNVDFKAAASLPLVGSSALQALEEHIKLNDGQKILITGGSGGIGTIAIQVAKNLGAYVATTTTGEGIEVVKQLGADEVIDYKTEDATKLLKDYDAIYDTVGGDGFNQTLKVLKKGGVAVTMAAKPDEKLGSELGVTTIAQMTHVTTERLSELAKLVEDGVVKSQPSQTFSLDNIVGAFKAKETGNVIGKVVIEIR